MSSTRVRLPVVAPWLLGALAPAVALAGETVMPPAPAWTTTKVVELSRSRASFSQPVLVGRSTERLWFPTLVNLGDGRLVAVMSVDYDSVQHQPQAKFSFSADGGRSWDDPRLGGQPGSSVSLANGDRLLLPVYLCAHPDGLTGPYQVIPKGTLQLKASDGRDLVVSGLPRHSKTIDTGDGQYCFGFNGQTLRLKDGSYLATLYGRYVGDTHYHLITATSRDGRAWQYCATIATPAITPRGYGGEGPGETALCRLKDGRLMCIFRIKSELTYGQAWSADDGRTWTKPAIDANGDASLTMADKSVRSVQPSLAALPNGVVVLSGGRPGVSVWVNERGDGQDWTRIDLSAHHNTLQPGEPHVTSAGDATKHSTSGYTEVVALDDRHLLLIYDRLRGGWDNIGTPSQSNSVWVVRLTVEPR